jgi:hypothetical protein
MLKAMEPSAAVALAGSFRLDGYMPSSRTNGRLAWARGARRSKGRSCQTPVRIVATFFGHFWLCATDDRNSTFLFGQFP